MIRSSVLVLDGDPKSGALQTRRLERAGYRAFRAETTEEAFELLKDNPIDIITVDYALQGEVSGLSFCANLRASGSRVPIIMVSGSTDQRAIVEALRIGIQDFIAKDADFLKRLPVAISGALDRTRVQFQLTTPLDLPARLTKSAVVLVVEGDQTAATQQVRELSRTGYAVRVAATPDEAVRFVQQDSIGLIVMDQLLDGQDTGLDVYRKLRSSGYEIPAILVTGRSDTATAAAALRGGFRDYIEKLPGYTSELPAMVQRVFERVHFERQVANSNARLMAIVSSAIDAIVTVEPNGVITLFNAAAEATFGSDAGAALGTNIARFLPGLFTPTGDGQFVLTGPARLETTGRRKDGSIFPVEASTVATEVSGKKFFTVIARDVTERKRAETELRELNQDLEQFAYSASHDLNEPLRNISLYAQMLAKRFATETDPQADMFLAGITEGASRMEKLLRDLLTYTEVLKIRQSQPPPVLVNSGKVLASVTHDFQKLIKETGATVTAGNLPSVPMVESHLRRLFQNLISNAIKYRGNEPPCVHIAAARQEQNWLFSVADNGIGIEPRYHDQIFGLFKRLHPRSVHSGSGLGLAICKRIVERYGGRIWAESEFGAGATFFFTLPASGRQ